VIQCDDLEVASSGDENYSDAAYEDHFRAHCLFKDSPFGFALLSMASTPGLLWSCDRIFRTRLHFAFFVKEHHEEHFSVPSFSIRYPF